MATALISALIMTLPLVLSGSFHMWVVRRDWLRFLARPIHERAFGRNKSWRGVVVMALATVPGVALTRLGASALGAEVAAPLAAVPAWWLGTWLGLGYALAELPNSFVKRRLGIAPGAPARRGRRWFRLVDQADSAVGCAIAYAFLIDVPGVVLLLLVLLGPAVHAVANVSLYSVGLRREAF